jgi:hypothetical protein
MMPLLEDCDDVEIEGEDMSSEAADKRKGIDIGW